MEKGYTNQRHTLHNNHAHNPAYTYPSSLLPPYKQHTPPSSPSSPLPPAEPLLPQPPVSSPPLPSSPPPQLLSSLVLPTLSHLPPIAPEQQVQQLCLFQYHVPYPHPLSPHPSRTPPVQPSADPLAATSPANIVPP